MKFLPFSFSSNTRAVYINFEIISPNFFFEQDRFYVFFLIHTGLYAYHFATGGGTTFSQCNKNSHSVMARIVLVIGI